ncbi:MAG TPA: hypothetical protein VMW16_01595 [Sedimentisphaerales bacterium]|nr:hypothetical protein [Sedimentisphaerales bacterium]
MRKKNLLIALLVLLALYPAGCGKVGLKDPVFLPGLSETYGGPAEAPPGPKFHNGDIVRYRMLADKQGIMMQSDYRYIPRLGAWYCIVDFYPSSALIHFDFSGFDNYERRYVYEFELELVKPYGRPMEMPARWKWMAALAP